MTRTQWLIVVVNGVLLTIVWVLVRYGYISTTPSGTPTASEGSFTYTWNTTETFNESEEQDTSSRYWWLNSGAYMLIEDGVGKTIQGDLPMLHHWRLAYAFSNPVDTDNGYHPQNLFRLVSRSTWDNPRVSARFRIIRDHLSTGPNRNESNGVFLMSRYVDGDTLYYAGFRVDGTAVIKKKYHGVYYIIAQKPIFPGRYDREHYPTLLPHSEWIEIMSETTTQENGSVLIRLFMRRANESDMTLVLEGVDISDTHMPVITAPSRIGIRADFMDVEFGTIRVEEIRHTGTLPITRFSQLLGTMHTHTLIAY